MNQLIVILSCFVFSFTSLFSQSFPNNTPVRINAGGPAGTFGGVSFERGDTHSYGSNGNFYSISSSAGPIANTGVPELYRSESSHTHLQYSLPIIDDNCYAVHLHFAEIWFNSPGGAPGWPGFRVFDVVINGDTVLNDFDMLAQAGASMTALVRSFRVCLAPGEGQIELEFISGDICGPEANLSAIEIVSEGTGPANPSFPVEWLSFEANIHDDQALLEWATATELNNDYFAVERSVDGRQYQEIARVAGAGYSDEVQFYQVEDPDPIRGTAYYRILQTDFDGTKSYSEVISLRYRSLVPELLAYPNPMQRGSTLSLNLTGFSPESRLLLRIQDLRGTPVWEERAQADTEGNFSLQMDATRHLAPGMYILTAGGESAQLIRRIAVE